MCLDNAILILNSDHVILSTLGMHMLVQRTPGLGTGGKGRKRHIMVDDSALGQRYFIHHPLVWTWAEEQL